MTTTKTFNYSHTVGFLAATGRGFTNPVDLAINSQDVIYVINRAGPETPIRLPSKRVTMCNLNEDWFGDFGTGGKGDGQFWWPSAIIIDSDDQVYVADEALQRISVFNKDGEFLRKWGAKGSESGPTAATTECRNSPKTDSSSLVGENEDPDPVSLKGLGVWH